MNKTSAIVVVILLLSASVGLNVYQSQNNPLTATTNTTCSVQNRGLQAQPHLTKAMDLIVQLLTPPPGTKIAKGQEKAYALSEKLRAELAAYVAIENKQPKRRKC